VQSSVCADTNIWSGNKKEWSCWRDGRGIGETGEKIGKKIGEKMGEKMGEKIGGKMGEERYEGERETAQVTSSVGVVVKYTVVTDSGPLAWGGKHLSGPSLKVDERRRA